MINEEKRIWVEKAIEMNLTKLQIIKKLQEANYKDEDIEELIGYYENQKEPKKEEEIKNDEEFEKDVKKYSENPTDLNYFKRREIKKWFTKIKKQIKAMDLIIKGLKAEIEELDKRFGKDNKKLEKELKQLKEEIIDRIIDLKSILIIEHPYKEVEVTKENLKDVNIDVLIELIEKGKDELEEIVEGKI